MRKLLVFFFLLLGFVVYDVSGQDVPDIGNLQNINVDDLSDEQIAKFSEKVASSGYSQQQLEILAKARGMSDTQISKLRQRMMSVQSGSGSGSGSNELSRLRGAPDLVDNNQTAFDPFDGLYKKDSSKVKNDLPIFGMSFFENSNLTFEPSVNIPTPENYLLGPGDQIIIDIWGASENSYQLSISPEGSVIIPNIGPVYLNGLVMEKAEAKLKSKLKSIYSTLGDKSFAQVSLGQIRTISVNVVGEVKKPGTYQLSSFATAFNALYMAGGPSQTGSLREILVFRNGKKIGELDAYQFLIYGEGTPISLSDQDVVLVKPYISRVAVKGQVKRPAYYEATEAETFAQVLEFAGGFTDRAYTKTVSLQRNDENFKTVKTIDKERFSDLTINNGDVIDVSPISNQFRNRLRVEGAVNHPGEFEFIEGMMLSDLLELFDGFRDDAFMHQALVIRENDNLTLSNIAFKPSELIDGTFDLELKSSDLIKVQSIFDLAEDFTLRLEGEVLAPGNFPYAEGLTVENLIYLGGGFKEAAAKSFVEVARRITDDTKGESYSSEVFNFPISEDLNLSEEASTFELQPFDLVVIRKSPYYEKQKTIDIQGEVQFPGTYVIQTKNERISDVMKRAGDLTAYAYPKGATLIRRSEYYATTDDESATAAKVRREELSALFERDTLLEGGSSNTFRKQESIGIQLDQIMKNPGSSYDLILKEGDLISIPRELQTVRVRGQVLYPSTVRFDNAYSFKKFVSKAGGFSDKALKKKSYIVYANGTAEKTSSFLWFKKFPDVQPGAELIIPEKPPKRKLTPGEIVGISSGLSTLSWVVFQIVNSL
ncbi:MAG: SLBB domain-containing protein [Cyclobacteriaceae bacterium]